MNSLIFYDSKKLCVNVAIAASTNGATIKIHNVDKVSPPVKIAGAILLVRFTEVSVNGIPIKCTIVYVKPITSTAKLGAINLVFVTDNTTNTNMKVRITSIKKAPILLMLFGTLAP